MYLRLIYYPNPVTRQDQTADETVLLRQVSCLPKGVFINELHLSQLVSFYDDACARSFYEMIIQAMTENKPILNVDITKMQLVGCP